MGGGRWTSKDWDGYTKSRGITQQSTVNQIYKSRHMQDSLNPYGVKYRESCHSDDNPKSTAVITGLDVTGSMGYLSEEIAKGALNTFINEMYDKRPVTDPHVMIAAIGDAYTHSAPPPATPSQPATPPAHPPQQPRAHTASHPSPPVCTYMY